MSIKYDIKLKCKNFEVMEQAKELELVFGKVLLIWVINLLNKHLICLNRKLYTLSLYMQLKIFKGLNYYLSL